MKRWYQSRTMWLNLMSFLANVLTVIATTLVAVAPEALAMLPTLGLSQVQSVVAIIGINAVINGANMWLRRNSPAAIGTADDVDAYVDAVDRGGLMDDGL